MVCSRLRHEFVGEGKHAKGGQNNNCLHDGWEIETHVLFWLVVLRRFLVKLLSTWSFNVAFWVEGLWWLSLVHDLIVSTTALIEWKECWYYLDSEVNHDSWRGWETSIIVIAMPLTLCPHLLLYKSEMQHRLDTFAVPKMEEILHHLECIKPWK